MRSFLGRGPLPERVDITILGGGVNGVALARACAQANKSVLLIERDDFASGATSRCTRIVHGGLHYLEQGELGMFHESIRGLEALLRERPHLVQSLDFVFAAAPKSRYSSFGIRAGLWLYHMLSRVPPSGTAAELDSQMEAVGRSLDPSRRWALHCYQDAICAFPERLVADWLTEACGAGAIVRNHTEALSIRTSDGRVCGVIVRDRVTGQESYIRSEWVINATGPWVDAVRDLTGLAAHSPLSTGIRASHVMLRRFPGDVSLGVHATAKRGRPISITPWNEMWQVSSTETSHGGGPVAAPPTTQEVEFLLTSAAELFPRAVLTSDDIVYSYAGVRPVAYRSSERLLRSEFGALASRHIVHNHAEEGALGMFSVFGGTITTATSIARKTARRMGLHPPGEPAAEVAIGTANGVENTLRQWGNAVHVSTGIPQESAEAIARWHGRHAMFVVQTAMHDPVMRAPIVDGQPQLVAQAVEAVAYEHAVTLADVLLRRVPMALDQDWNEDSTVQAAGRIGRALNWTEHRVREEIEAFQEERNQFLWRPKNLKPSGIAA
jgi:glycerol-3-phosphate dehydrogenase